MDTGSLPPCGGVYLGYNPHHSRRAQREGIRMSVPAWGWGYRWKVSTPAAKP